MRTKARGSAPRSRPRSTSGSRRARASPSRWAWRTSDHRAPPSDGASYPLDGSPTNSIDLCIGTCLGYATKDEGPWRFTFTFETGLAEQWASARITDAQGTVEVTLHGVTRMMARLEGDACLRADGATWLCASLAPVLYADPFGRAGMTTGGAALSFGVAHF